MPSKTLRSVKGKVARFTLLDACGDPITGDCSTLVTEGFVRVRFAPEIEQGEEFSLRNAWGDYCVLDNDDDRYKWLNVTVDLCGVDPAVVSLLGGATPLVDDDDTIIGFAAGGSVNTNPFAIEVWAAQAGQGCAVGGNPEWVYYVAPFVRNGRIDGEIVVERGVATLSLVGKGYHASSAWGDGPYGDDPLVDTGGFPEGELWAQVVTGVQPPAPTDGCVAFPPVP